MMKNNKILSLIEKVHFTNVQKYLLRTNWTKINTKREHIVLFYLENSTNERVAEILLPLSKDFADYTKTIYEAILTISEVENREAEQIINDLLLPPSDIIRFRVQNESENIKNGLIKLSDSFTLLDFAKKSLYVAACDFLNKTKETYYKRLYDKRVERFIDNCYLGQTERGSFIASIVCPFLNGIDSDEVSKMSLFNSEEELNNSITRSITQKYIKSVNKIKSIVEEDKYESFFTLKNDDHISLNFVESIVELADFDKDNIIEIIPSFSIFSNGVSDISKSVILTKDYIEPLKSIVKKHIPKYEVEKKYYFGKISSAATEPELEDREDVVLLFHYMQDTEATKAKVILSKEYFNEALNAMKHSYNVIITGKMKVNGKSKTFEYPEFKIIKPEKFFIED